MGTWGGYMRRLDFGDFEIWRFGDLEIWGFEDLEIWRLGDVVNEGEMKEHAGER
jgi:hypothetical protein